MRVPTSRRSPSRNAQYGISRNEKSINIRPPREPRSSGRESAPSEPGGKSEPTHVGCYGSGVQCAKRDSANSHPGPLPQERENLMPPHANTCGWIGGTIGRNARREQRPFPLLGERARVRASVRPFSRRTPAQSNVEAEARRLGGAPIPGALMGTGRVGDRRSKRAGQGRARWRRLHSLHQADVLETEPA
jgi:hypothetical protein